MSAGANNAISPLSQHRTAPVRRLSAPKSSKAALPTGMSVDTSKLPTRPDSPSTGKRPKLPGSSISAAAVAAASSSKSKPSSSQAKPSSSSKQTNPSSSSTSPSDPAPSVTRTPSSLLPKRSSKRTNVRSGKNLVDVSTKFIRGQSVEQIKSVMETQKRLHALEDAGGEGSSAGQDVHETFVPANMPSTRELHLKQHIEELEREIKGKSEFIVSVQRNYSVVAVSLSSVQDEIVHSRALVREWKQRVGDLEQNIVDFDGLKRELISKKKEVEAGVVKAIHDKKSIKMLEDKIKNLQLQMFDLMEQKQALNEELLGNKKELKTKSEGLRALETLHSDQKGAGDEILKAKLRECESELQYAVGALESARADAQESKAVASRAGLELNKLKNIRTRDTLDKENLQNDVSRLRAQLAQKKSEIKASQDVAAGHVEEDGDLSGVSKAELMARLKFAENSGIRIMKVRLAEQQTALDAELKKQLGVLEGKIRRECNSKSTSELEALAKQFQEDTQRSTAVHMAGVAGLASQLAALQDKHDELSNENEGLKLKLSSVQGEATAQQASLLSQASSREKAILELESKHAVNQAQVIALTARLSSVESELDAQSGKFAQEKSVFEQAALSEYGAKLQQLSEQNTLLGQTNLKLVSDVKGLQAVLARRDKKRPPSPSFSSSSSSDKALRAFELKERELHSVVAKLLVSETATEPSFTCTQCMSLFKDPVTCVPCGHSFCKSCVEEKGHCTQCGPSVQITYYTNGLLSELSHKYTYRKQVLSSLVDAQSN